MDATILFVFALNCFTTVIEVCTDLPVLYNFFLEFFSKVFFLSREISLKPIQIFIYYKNLLTQFPVQPSFPKGNRNHLGHPSDSEKAPRIAHRKWWRKLRKRIEGEKVGLRWTFFEICFYKNIFLIFTNM